MPVAPRIVNDVSYVMRINHEIHFAWQVQDFVKLEGDSFCYTHCKITFQSSTGVVLCSTE